MFPPPSPLELLEAGVSCGGRLFVHSFLERIAEQCSELLDLLLTEQLVLAPADLPALFRLALVLVVSTHQLHHNTLEIVWVWSQSRVEVERVGRGESNALGLLDHAIHGVAGDSRVHR